MFQKNRFRLGTIKVDVFYLLMPPKKISKVVGHDG